MSFPYSHLQDREPPPPPLPIPTRSVSNPAAHRSPRSASHSLSPLSPPSTSFPLAPTPVHPSGRPALLAQRSSSSSGISRGAGYRHPSVGSGSRPAMYNHRSSSSSGAGGYASSSTDLTELERASGQSPHLPPTYARSALDRSSVISPDSASGTGLYGQGQGTGYGQAGQMQAAAVERMLSGTRVPPPLYLRSSSPQGVSTKGTLKIHIPAWGVVLVRPPNQLDLSSPNPSARVPCEDTVLSGAIEVIMKERRRVQAISVGVQSVCRLFMGVERGWEEDGIFERGVEIMGGECGEEGIWLEKGSQSFTFSLILPATLATHDYHQFGRVSYIITARVEGVAETTRSLSFSSIFKGGSTHASTGASPVLGVTSEIPYKEDFDAVIARSDKLAQEIAQHSPRHGSTGASGGLGLSPKLSRLSLSPEDDSAVAHSPLASGLSGSGLGLAGLGGAGGGNGINGDTSSPTLNGLYHRRSSFDVVDRSGTISPAIPPLALPSTGNGSDDTRSIHTVHTINGKKEERDERHGWMKGDLVASRGLILHANPSPTGGVNQLDVRKEGFVDGLGSWRFSASADVWSISAILLLSISFPQPSPKCTVFLVRLLLQQSYTLTSPRTPNELPRKPEQMRTHVLYQLGRAHKAGERFPTRDVESLWRGTEAGGSGNVQSIGEEGGQEEGWKVRAMARVPGHDKVRPSTHAGTITPIRVTHDLVLQTFYSVDGELVSGQPTPPSAGKPAGSSPGELRMMAVKVGVMVPSCCCTVSSLDLPTYTKNGSKQDIDAIISTPAEKHGCMCGSTFAELGEAAMRRMQAQEAEDREREAELEREREECRRLHATAPWSNGGPGPGSGASGSTGEGSGSEGLGLTGLGVGMGRTGSAQGRGSPKLEAEAMSRGGSFGGGGRPDGTG